MGKRSGDGFVAHKAILASALSRALAERVMLMDLTIGRKGFGVWQPAVANLKTTCFEGLSMPNLRGQ